MRGNRGIHAIAAKALRPLITESGDTSGRRYNFDTGIPYCAVEILDEESLSGFRESDILSLRKDTLCKLWYNAKKLTLTFPGGERTVSIDRIFSSAEHPDRATTAIQNHLVACRAAFFYPLSYIWELDELPEDDDGQDVSLSMNLSVGGGIFATDGEGLFWPPLVYSDRYEGEAVDGGFAPTYAVTSGGDDNTGNKVGTMTFLGEKSDLYSPDEHATDYGDVTVEIEEEW